MHIVASSGKSSRRRWAICCGLHALTPAPVLPGTVPPALPRHRSPAWSSNHAGQPVLHINPQRRVDRQLRRLRAPGGPFGMPLRRGGPILQAATARRGVAPVGRSASDPARSSISGEPLSSTPTALPTGRSPVCPCPATQDRKLLSFRKRHIPPRKRLCTSSKHRWCHAAGLPEPSCSDSLRHTGPNRSILTG